MPLGRVFGVAITLGVGVLTLRKGLAGRGKDSRLAGGFNEGLAAPALIPGPTDWLKVGFAIPGVLPPWLKLLSRVGVPGTGLALIPSPDPELPGFFTAFSSGKNMPDPGIVVLK